MYSWFPPGSQLFALHDTYKTSKRKTFRDGNPSLTLSQTGDNSIPWKHEWKNADQFGALYVVQVYLCKYKVFQKELYNFESL